MSCLYEVTLRVESVAAAEYDAWLREHVAEMLTLPGFVAAHIHAVEAQGDDQTGFTRVVHYRLADRAAFDRYVKEHAARMRQQGLERFGDRVTASRRILLPLANG